MACHAENYEITQIIPATQLCDCLSGIRCVDHSKIALGESPSELLCVVAIVNE
jgi:hypothetical protein